ncbi:MAG TPA: hypothetical protein VMV13_07385 [Candidatus Binataceae bacterium]|nr:hypothetical protein [Candidatus Binataceae bacterium]
MLIYLLLAAVASMFMGGGLVMMKSRSAHLPVASGTKILNALGAWLADPMWLGGLGVQTLGFAIYVVALSQAQVSMVAVMMQGGTAMFVIIAVVLLKERADLREWIGISATVLGMAMLAASLSSSDTEGALDGRALMVLSVALIALALAPMATARLRETGAAAAILSGVAFGLASLYTKGMTTDFLARPETALVIRIAGNPYVYLLVIANIAGTILLQNSFHTARGIIAVPLSSALSNVVPILGGIIAFGEHLPSAPASAAMRVGAFALTIAASAVLAGSRDSPLA